MKSKEWYLKRKNHITGTDISAIMGLNPWKSPLSVYIDKIEPDYIDHTHNDAMHFGTLLEPIVAEEYARRSGNAIYEEPEMLVSSKCSFAAANIDRWINNKNAILECKTTGSFSSTSWGAEGTDQVPKHVLMQVAWYAFVADVPYCDIAVLIGGQDFRIYRYDRNYTLENGLVMLARDFWRNHVLIKNPPHSNTPQDLLKLYPEALPKQIKADPAIKSKIFEIAEIKNEIKIKEERMDFVKSEIQNHMKDAAELIDRNGEVLATWKNTKPRISFDKDSFIKENKDLYNKYKIEKPGPRVFNIKKWSYNDGE